MIIPDTQARDEQLARQGGFCVVTGHPIEKPATGILVGGLDSSEPVVVSWLGGLALDSGVQTEAALPEFHQIFSVRQLRREFPALVFFPPPRVAAPAPPPAELVEWVQAHPHATGSGWLTVLAWTAWLTVCDSTQPIQERGWAASLLLLLEEETERVTFWKPQAKVVMPSQWLETSAFLMTDEGFAHQLFAHRTELELHDLRGAEAVQMVVRVLKDDPTPALFISDSAEVAIKMTPDERGLPFLGGALEEIFENAMATQPLEVTSEWIEGLYRRLTGPIERVFLAHGVQPAQADDAKWSVVMKLLARDTTMHARFRHHRRALRAQEPQ